MQDNLWSGLCIFINPEVLVTYRWLVEYLQECVINAIETVFHSNVFLASLAAQSTDVIHCAKIY